MNDTYNLETQKQYPYYANAPVYLISSLTANPRVDAAHYMAAGATIGGFLARIADFFKGLSARPRLRQQLLAMDDRMLDDIGLTRGDIEDVIAGRYGVVKTAPKAPQPTAKIHDVKPASKAPKVEAILRRAA